MACEAHRGQVYPTPQGEPYVLHLFRVMLAFEDAAARSVAVLHDILEDTPTTARDLVEAGMSPEIVDAVVALTRDPGETYASYIARVAANGLARRVKMADIADNLANNRRLPVTPEVSARVARYEAALDRLGGAEEAVAVPGASLWTWSVGAGTPLVLAHGGPGLSNNLGPIAGMVDDVAAVHLYDQRGGGRSAGGGPFDVETFVADLEALRRHWGHERWIVGGHSWGAALALFYALAHPERTLGVVYLGGTSIRWEARERAHAERMRRLTAAEREELDTLALRLARREDDEARARFLRLLWTTDFATRAAADGALERGPLYEYPRADAVARSVEDDWRRRLDGGIEDQLAALPVPVLVLHGEADPDPGAREVGRIAPRGVWAPIAGAGHSPWLEDPAAVGRYLRGFVLSLAAPESGSGPEGSGAIEFRDARTSDPVLTFFDAALSAEVDRRRGHAPTGTSLPADLEPPDGAILVAHRHGRPVGMGAVRGLGGAIAEVKRMYVSPDARGEGVGGALLGRLEMLARERGCRSVRLDTADVLAEAIALYRARGYAEVPDYNGNDAADRWFEKSLAG
ncbi:MAG: alpha/beta fold hydrolase [Actinobacteria bacterium]|nr:alpha/beta fold hydrolase [Actinomycetota bacterium]